MNYVDLNCRKEASKLSVMPIDILSFNIWDNQLSVPGTLDLSLSFNVTKKLSNDILFSTKQQRRLGLSWIHVPCFTGIGECDKQLLCSLIRHKCKMNAFVGTTHRRNQSSCPCDLGVGTYTIEHISLPIMRKKSAKLVQPITPGQYRFQVMFFSQKKSQIGCVIGYLTLSKPTKFT